jgi:hypothetical protein
MIAGFGNPQCTRELFANGLILVVAYRGIGAQQNKLKFSPSNVMSRVPLFAAPYLFVVRFYKCKTYTRRIIYA